MFRFSQVPQFDRLYVVSDLHLGGIPGHQIFNQGSRLAAFIRHIASSSKRVTGLVLNGDIVDFLADQNPQYLDPKGAVDKLETIYDDPAFREVWVALSNSFYEASIYKRCQLVGE